MEEFEMTGFCSVGDVLYGIYGEEMFKYQN
jgi:hypothetical protein